jgi:hypothetical protein
MKKIKRWHGLKTGGTSTRKSGRSKEAKGKEKLSEDAISPKECN